jgi:hypothetical protein
MTSKLRSTDPSGGAIEMTCEQGFQGLVSITVRAIPSDRRPHHAPEHDPLARRPTVTTSHYSRQLSRELPRGTSDLRDRRRGVGGAGEEPLREARDSCL